MLEAKKLEHSGDEQRKWNGTLKNTNKKQGNWFFPINEEKLETFSKPLQISKISVVEPLNFRNQFCYQVAVAGLGGVKGRDTFAKIKTTCQIMIYGGKLNWFLQKLVQNRRCRSNK